MQMLYFESKARGGCAVVHVGEAYIDSVHGVDGYQQKLHGQEPEVQT